MNSIFRWTIIINLIAFGSTLIGQSEIKIKVSDYQSDTLILGYYFADRQLVQDTLLSENKKDFIVSDTDSLHSGMYLLLVKPSNSFIQFLIPEKDREFDIAFSYNDLEKIKYKGSKVNEDFQEYLKFLSDQRIQSDELNKQRAELDSLGDSTDAITQKIQKLNEKVNDYQSKLLDNHQDDVLAKLIRSGNDIDIPEFSGTEEEIRLRRYMYYKEHYFDHVDISDQQNIYMPYMHQRVDYYLNKLTTQMPDSIMLSMDYLLEKMESAPESYKFYLSNFLNTYGKMKIIGMDAVYVHLVENYYAKDKAPWVDEKNLKKLINNARRIKPSLIGNTGSDLTLYKEDSTAVKLSEIEGEYLVLMFWAPDCGHCKKAMPDVIKFNEEYKDKGVTVVGICTKHQEKYDSCWKAVEEKGMMNLLNLGDKYHRSRFKTKYNINMTPKIFILDRDLKILIKDIGAKQLSEVMDSIMKNNASKSTQ